MAGGLHPHSHLLVLANQHPTRHSQGLRVLQGSFLLLPPPFCVAAKGPHAGNAPGSRDSSWRRRAPGRVMLPPQAGPAAGLGPSLAPAAAHRPQRPLGTSSPQGPGRAVSEASSPR